MRAAVEHVFGGDAAVCARCRATRGCRCDVRAPVGAPPATRCAMHPVRARLLPARVAGSAVRTRDHVLAARMPLPVFGSSCGTLKPRNRIFLHARRRLRPVRRRFAADSGALGRGANFVDHRDRRTGRNGLAFLDDHLANDAGDRRGHFGVDFVGRDLDERLRTSRPCRRLS